MLRDPADSQKIPFFRPLVLSLAGIIILAGIVFSIWHFFAGNSGTDSSGTSFGSTAIGGTGPITIILSTHFDDAVLSLGGLLARHDRPALVATFFTAAPQTATTTQWDTYAGFTNSTSAENVRTLENQHALTALGVSAQNFGYLDNQYGQAEDSATLEGSIAQDIQTLLVAYAGRPVYLYGPSTFGPAITHPDHELLHDAFVDVANNFPASNVSFFFYEDYPYVSAFDAATATSTMSLQKFLENDSGLFLTQTTIPLSSGQVDAKISALKLYQSQVKAFSASGIDVVAGDQSYTDSRCGPPGNAGSSCEVVYQIMGQNQNQSTSGNSGNQDDNDQSNAY